MAYELDTKNLITEPQTVREGMCLADWESVPGFDPSKLDQYMKDAKLLPILPPTLGTLRQLNLDTSHDSPNYGGSGYSQRALPIKEVVIHWWGTPSNQDPYGIIAWLCNPISQVSAHAVIWPGNVAVIVNYDWPSWANGNTWANQNSITIECDPNHIEETINTIGEWIADMVKAGNIARDFHVSGHKDWHNTTCPGGYYQLLGRIHQKALDYLAGTASADTPQEEEDDEMYAVCSCPARGIALVGPGHFSPCLSDQDVKDCLATKGVRVWETNDPAAWDRWVRLFGRRPESVDLAPVLKAIEKLGEGLNLSDEALQQIRDAVASVGADDVAGQLEIIAKATPKSAFQVVSDAVGVK